MSLEGIYSSACPTTPLLGRGSGHRTGAVLTEDDVRELRWEAAKPGFCRRDRERFARRLHVSVCTIDDVLRGDTFAFVVGPPLSARYWKRSQRTGLLLWIVWWLMHSFSRKAVIR